MTEDKLLQLIHNGEFDDYIETLNLRIKKLRNIADDYARLMDAIETSFMYDLDIIQKWSIHVLRDYLRKRFDVVWEWKISDWDLANIKAQLAHSIVVDGVMIKDLYILNGRRVTFEGTYHNLTDVNEDTYFRIHGYRQAAVAFQIQISKGVKYLAINMFPRWHQYVYLMSTDGRRLSNTVLNAGIILIPVKEPGDYFLVVGELFDRESIIMISDIIALGEYQDVPEVTLSWKPAGFYNYFFAYPLLAGKTALKVTDGTNSVDISYGINFIQKWMVEESEARASTSIDYLGTHYDKAYLVDSISPIVAKKTEGERLIYYFPKLTTVKGNGRLLQLDLTWRFTRPIDIDGERSLIGVFKSDGSDFEIGGIYLSFSEPLYFIDRDYFYIKDSRGHIYLVFRRDPSELEAGDAIYWYNLKDMSIKVKATHGGVLFMGSDNTLLPLAPKRPINFELGGYGEGSLLAPGGTPMEEEEEIS